MKTRQILLYLIILILTSCKPEEQPTVVSYVFSDVSVVVGQTSATITCRNESVDDDKVHASVLLSKNENITNATKYPLSLQNDTLRSTISGLENNTIYFFCFEVYTANEHKRTDEVRHFQTSMQANTYTINVSPNPSNGGTVTGGGSYNQGQSCTVIATSANGFRFTNWTEGGHEVSTNANYTFTVNDNRTLVANFSEQAPNTYSINASPNPSNGGTVTGDGSYEQGQSCTLTATANTGYTFTNWTENGSVVSTNANYTFTVNANRTLVANFTANPQNYTISVSANPSNGGSVSGGGTYQQGQSCTLTATANTGYTFTNWTENGSVVSTNANYTFTVNANKTLVANFTVNPQNYTISVSANPSNGGSVSGGGTYQQGQSCTVAASANTGFSFLRWTENGNQVSTNANYTFSVSSNRTLVAQFEAQVQTPTGAINGLFSVSSSKQVWFSQGNLQYIGSASTPYWRFAENQWDYWGTTSSQNGSNVNDDRDKFGWATSGCYTGGSYYMPYDIETAYPAYYQYGPSGEHDLTGQYANGDWGVYNPISNGGNTPNTWRTLSRSEWSYVLFNRTTASGIRFAKAIVNDVKGVVLLPDEWNASTYSLAAINNKTATYSSNVITGSVWTSTLEPHGAVFLPAAGTRTVYQGVNGYYWSTSASGSYQAYEIRFFDNDIESHITFRYDGCSVRLVQDL